MKIKCNKDYLKKGFHIVENVISGSSINPMLQNVKIVANENTLELSTTDMEVSVSHIIDSVEIMTPGKMICPKTQIASIAKEWTEDYIEINEEELKCMITGKSNYFKILCTDPGNFPIIPEFIHEDYIEIDRGVLLDMIKKTAFIILGEKSKHGSCGVFMNISENYVKMVANDGRRLAEVKKKIDNPNGISRSCVIPIKGILQMQRIVGDQASMSTLVRDDVIKLKIEEKRIFVKTTTTTLCSQLLDVEYPEYEGAIPKGLDRNVKADKNELASAIRRVSIMTTDEYKLLRFKFSAEVLEIKCISPDVGESKTELPIEFSGEELEIGLNPEFLLDFLKNVDSEMVNMEMRDSGTAVVFKVGVGCIYVVMPMNLGKEEQYDE